MAGHASGFPTRTALYLRGAAITTCALCSLSGKLSVDEKHCCKGATTPLSGHSCELFTPFARDCNTMAPTHCFKCKQQSLELKQISGRRCEHLGIAENSEGGRSTPPLLTPPPPRGSYKRLLERKVKFYNSNNFFKRFLYPNPQVQDPSSPSNVSLPMPRRMGRVRGVQLKGAPTFQKKGSPHPHTGRVYAPLSKGPGVRTNGNNSRASVGT